MELLFATTIPQEGNDQRKWNQNVEETRVLSGAWVMLSAALYMES